MLEKLPAAIGHALDDIRPGITATLWGDRDLGRLPDTLCLTSAAFADGAPLPARFTDDGAGVSPPLDWGRLPPGTVELILVVEDADPPLPRPLVHAIVHGIDPATPGIAEGALSADPPTLTTGANSFLRRGWLPPDPPRGHGDHRDLFQLYTLRAAAALGDKPGRATVRDAIAALGIARGLLVGIYARA